MSLKGPRVMMRRIGCKYRVAPRHSRNSMAPSARPHLTAAIMLLDIKEYNAVDILESTWTPCTSNSPQQLWIEFSLHNNVHRNSQEQQGGAPQCTYSSISYRSSIPQTAFESDTDTGVCVRCHRCDIRGGELTAIERVFSDAKRLITPDRNRLLDSTIEYLELLRYWWTRNIVTQNR